MLDEIKVQAVDLQEKIVENLRENIKEQMQDDTIVDRIENLEKLYNIYFSYCSHFVEEDDSEFSDNWEVQIKYPAKIDCSKEDLVKEFRSLWRVFNRI